MKRTALSTTALSLALVLPACGDSDGVDSTPGMDGSVDSGSFDGGLPDARVSSCFTPLTATTHPAESNGCACLVTKATRTGYCLSEGSTTVASCGSFGGEIGMRGTWSAAKDGVCAPMTAPSADRCVEMGGVLDASAGGYKILPRLAYDGGAPPVRCEFPIEVLADDCTGSGFRVVAADTVCTRRGFIVGDDAGARICCE